MTIGKICELQQEVGLPLNFLEFSPKPEQVEQAIMNVLTDPSGLVFKIPVDRLIHIVTKALFGI